jgi:hypothetical protein
MRLHRQLGVVVAAGMAVAGCSSINPGDGISPGMAFCFLGKEIPVGYAELNGAGAWPAASWVPDILRGKPLPNTMGDLIGVATNRSDIGTVSGNGYVTVPAQLQNKIETFSVIGRGGAYRWDRPGHAPTPDIGEYVRPGTGYDEKYNDPASNTWASGGNWPGKDISNNGWLSRWPSGYYPGIFELGWHDTGTQEVIARQLNYKMVDIYATPQAANDVSVNVTSAGNPPYLRCRWIVRE